MEVSGTLDVLRGLGLSDEQITERLIDAAVDRLLERTVCAYEPGADGAHEEEVPSEFAERVEARVRESVDAKLDAFFEAYMKPGVDSLIDNLTFQPTNTWGEPKKPPMTLREYVEKRRNEWWQEEVDNQGRNRKDAQRIGSFYPYGTRAAWLVDQHLRLHVERALKPTLEEANKLFADGLKKELISRVDELSARLKKGAK